MKNPILPHFTPVPRATHQHAGWTPARQKAFIEALAESGSPTRAARAVNMAVQSAYGLRRHPQGGEFRAAWEAAVDCGIARLKDVALQRAIEGELVPVFQKGVMVGYRRKFNDALLMFLLRQYGTGADGKRVTVAYVRSRADASAAGGAASAEASTMTVRTSRTAPDRDGATIDKARAAIEAFAGSDLDEATSAELANILADAAADARATEATIDDPALPFIRTNGLTYHDGSLEMLPFCEDAINDYRDGSPPWTMVGDEDALQDRARMIAMIEDGGERDDPE